jgi:hypothetical protein
MRTATARERVEKEISKLPLTLEKLTIIEDTIKHNLCSQSVKRKGSNTTYVNNKKVSIKKP